jgi:RNA polymerase sigma-70 factor (ECF subfamily)
MEPDHDPMLDDLNDLVDVVTDDQLRLVFLCCHPALSPDTQVAMTLRLLGGLETNEIARAFLTPEPTIAQRLVRGKRKLRDNNAPYRIPTPAELPDRVHVVLTVIALIFTEGHSASSGQQLVRTDLSNEAIRLGRVLMDLMPDEAEVAGLLALMLLTEARRPARTSNGEFVRLADQDRRLWDQRSIAEGHALVRQCLRRNQPGPYQIQAAIAAVHANAPRSADTDWSQIVTLYDLLVAQRPNPIVAMNRAIAVGELHGPEVGLEALDAIDPTTVASYQPFHAARADLLARCGQSQLASIAYRRAIELSGNQPERRFLQQQLARLSRDPNEGGTGE